jgi:bla regulator protein BlaR1
MLAIFDGFRVPPALWTLLDATVRSSLILLLAAGAAMLLRKRSAAWRHGVWASAIVLALLLPVFSALLPAWRLGVLPENASQPESQIIVAYHQPPGEGVSIISNSTAEPLSAVPQQELLPAASESPAKTSLLATLSNIPVSTWILSVWAVGAAVVIAPLLIGTINIRRIARKARRLIDGEVPALRDRLCKDLAIRRQVSLLQSEDSLVPVTWGIWRPTVLLPREAGQWSADRLRMVLLHELAHVRRKDCFIQLLSQLAQAM